jgi:serine/threonine-protein kinase
MHPLGIGGMAEIFKARALGSAGFARQVVIKRILPAYGSDPDFVRMFVDEAKILGVLHHPNVVQAYDFGEEDGALYLALEYVDGPSLSRVLRSLRASGRRMPPAVVAYVAREVCRALDYVHTLRDPDGRPLDIVHRDVTPSNVMLTPLGGVKLLDFGVAKFTRAAQMTKAGTVKGKPAYLAPEQLEGKPIDGRVDLFAVGIVMHEMLSLEHLFAGDSDLGTVKKIMEMEIPAPSTKRDDVPGELDRIVMKALERDRDRRYRNAAEMARDLDDFVIAAQLRVDDVVTFVREVETLVAAQIPQPQAVRALTTRARANVDLTRWDLGLALRMWGLRLSGGRRREALAAAVVVVALALATALGLRVTVAGTHEPALAATPASDAGAAADVRVVQAAVPSGPPTTSAVPTPETAPGPPPAPSVGGAPTPPTDRR